jgi:hypothetical protein
VLFSVYFPSTLVGYVVGGQGLILKTTTGGVGINPDPSPASFSIWPNPAKDILNVKLSADDITPNTLISLIDMTGRIVLQTTALTTATTLDLSTLRPSTYTLRLTTPTTTKTQILLKM